MHSYRHTPLQFLGILLHSSRHVYMHSSRHIYSNTCTVLGTYTCTVLGTYACTGLGTYACMGLGTYTCTVLGTCLHRCHLMFFCVPAGVQRKVKTVAELEADMHQNSPQKSSSGLSVTSSVSSTAASTEDMAAFNKLLIMMNAASEANQNLVCVLSYGCGD